MHTGKKKVQYIEVLEKVTAALTNEGSIIISNIILLLRRKRNSDLMISWSYQ